MEQKYWYLIVGIGIGWITKVPFLIKWYRELRRTRNYKKMMDVIHYEEMKAKFNEMYPNNKIK